MKFVTQEISGRGRARYLFALGRIEAGIMLDLLEKALRYSPRKIETAKIDSHVSHMIGEIRKALPILD